MQTIRLESGEWQFDESKRLGPKGGFGEVFLGHGSYGEVAVKRLLMSAGAAAHREMKIGETLASEHFQHVVPVLDYGRDANGDSYYLVMPVCDRSLQDLINEHGIVPWSEAKPIIIDIISGLQEVGNIVHRDLKPGNVLSLDGRWQIADFGIAKFVEDSTSLETLRQSLTPSYAAPEQWAGERPTGGTDVYALGCIIYSLLRGSPPFGGDIDDVREGHLHASPPSIEGIDSRLGGLLSVMLRKAQTTRPSLDRCKAQITATDVALPAAGPRASLAAAGQAVAQAAATDEAVRLAAKAAANEWKAIGDEGAKDFARLLENLSNAIISDAPIAQKGTRSVILGPAELKGDVPTRVERRTHPQRGRLPEGLWEVAAFSRVELRCTLVNRSYHDPSIYAFAVTLAFAKTPENDEFRWREVSFYKQFSSSMQAEPTAIMPNNDAFYVVFSNVTGSHAIAHGPYTVDAEDEGSFIERWTGLFAKAALGKLRPPQQLPLSRQFYD